MKFLVVLPLAFLVFTLGACEKKTDDAAATTTADPNAPTFTTAVTSSNISSTGFTLTWAATDNVTAAASIKFKVVKSGINNITTAADAEANGTVLQDYTANSTTITLGSLTAASTVYVSVLAKDDDSKISISTTSVTTLCSGKIIFLASVSNGSMGGISGADATCNANKPTGFSASTFKAMLAGGATRGICYSAGNDNCTGVTTGQADWVFTANQTYCSSDYSMKIGTTSSEKMMVTTNQLATAFTKVFSGFNIYWGTSTSNNCSNWSSTSGTATAGSASGFATSTTLDCNTAGSIYCVQQ